MAQLRKTLFGIALLVAIALTADLKGQVAGNLVTNGGFEENFKGWTRWGRNSNLITLDSSDAHSGTRVARVEHGHNALYCVLPLTPGQAYEIQFVFRVLGVNATGQVALNFSEKQGALRSAGFQVLELLPPAGGKTGEWIEFRKVFLPTPVTANCQIAFSAGQGSILFLDDITLREVPRPPGLAEPRAPWAALNHRTSRPLFKELLTRQPGSYSVVCWSHDLNPDGGKLPKSDKRDAASLEQEILSIFKEAGENGMGFLDLPGHLNASAPWRTAEFHREQFRKYGVRFDVWSEGGASIATGIKNGAEVLNPTAKDLGSRPALSWVDPKYVEAQAQALRHLGQQLRGNPFVGYYYGKDEPTIHLPQGEPGDWGEYGRAMAAEVLERYGFGRFGPPLRKTNDPEMPLRWIAYNRWANDKFIESRSYLSRVLHQADPNARYSPADYWFMSGFVPYDYSRLALCSDLMELDPYASSAEKTPGRGVFNHGFGAKFMSDLTGKPVRIVAQAFDYAGYDMKPDDLREWVSQALRCGASAIDYYTMDRPRWTHPERWKMMLYLSSRVTRMNRIALPKTADTAILYALYTHMSEGASTSGNQLYAAHALIGELAGSWYQFVCDGQLERGEKSLSGYKVVYLPSAKYMTSRTSRILEEYVENGGVLVCGDAEAFSFDLAGNDTSAIRERILGIKTIGRNHAEKIVMQSGKLGVKAGMVLPVSAQSGSYTVRALSDSKELARYPDNSPAILLHRLGKGRVITFAANPFAPDVTVTGTDWPRFFQQLQRKLGCKTDLPIWRFAIPAPNPAKE